VAQVFLEEVALGKHSPETRQAAILALGMIEAPTTGRAAERLTHDTNPLVRMAGYRAIGWSRDRRYIPRCVEGLADPVPLTASMAAKALGRLNDPATTDRLVEASRKTQFGELRFFILEALGRHKYQPALEELMRVVQDPRFVAQTDAATFLYEVGERRALPIFRELLDETLRGRPNQAGMDTITAYALGAMDDKEAVPVLLTALKKGRIDVRREAAAALGVLGDARAVPELIAAIATADRQLRVRSLLALGKLRGFELARPIQAALGDRDPPIRWAGVVALESRGDASAIPALKPLLRDPHPFVAAAARSAIALLEGVPSVEKDARAEAILVRLRALERELTLRDQNIAVTAQTTWERVVGYESYWSTCGGTHPPIEYRVEITETVTTLEAPGGQSVGAGEIERRREDVDAGYDLRLLHGDGQRLREDAHDRARDAEGGAGDR
jgi:HEAT repeat protein